MQNKHLWPPAEASSSDASYAQFYSPHINFTRTS